MPRCKKLKALRLTDSDGGVNNEILQILTKIDLEKLQLLSVNFESLDKVLFANVISKTKAVHLFAPKNLEQDNVKMIMKMIPGSCIKELLLDQVKFSRVASRTVAKAINSLEIFSVVNNHDEQQITKTFKEMSKKTNLKKMVLLNTHLLKNVPTTHKSSLHGP